MNDTLTIAERIKERLASCEMTQRELAEKLNITEVTMYRIIHGEKKPDDVLLARMAHILMTSMNYLKHGKPPQEMKRERAMEILNRFADCLENEHCEERGCVYFAEMPEIRRLLQWFNKREEDLKKVIQYLTDIEYTSRPWQEQTFKNEIERAESKGFSDGIKTAIDIIVNYYDEKELSEDGGQDKD